MSDQSRAAERDAQVMRGLPRTLHSPLTPPGAIDQSSKIADGLRVRHEGWRRVVVPTGLALMACAILTAVLVGILAAR